MKFFILLSFMSLNAFAQHLGGATGRDPLPKTKLANIFHGHNELVEQFSRLGNLQLADVRSGEIIWLIAYNPKPNVIEASEKSKLLAGLRKQWNARISKSPLSSRQDLEMQRDLDLRNQEAEYLVTSDERAAAVFVIQELKCYGQSKASTDTLMKAYYNLDLDFLLQKAGACWEYALWKDGRRPCGGGGECQRFEYKGVVYDTITSKALYSIK